MQPAMDGKTSGTSDGKRLALEIVWLAAVAFISGGACLSAAQQFGPTYDETVYFEFGLRVWERGNHAPLAQLGTMPLPVDLQTLPLAIAKYLFGHDPRADFIGYLPYMRMMTLVFWWWLLGASYFAVRGRVGVAAACLTVGILAAEPVLLGHSTLATTDIAAAATLVTVIFVSQRTYDQVKSKHVRRLITGGAVALALLAKATALVFVPVCLFAVETERLWRSGWRPRLSRDALLALVPAVREVSLIFGLGLLMVVIPFPRMLHGMVFQVKHNVSGHGIVYLLGDAAKGGFWYYFFVAAASKFTLTLLGFVVGAVALGRRNLMNAPLLAATVLLVLSPGYHVQIGVRFIFGIMALFVVGASIALFERRGALLPTLWPRRLGYALATIAICGSAFEAFRTWPNGLCFTNQAFGGTARGYLTLCESNYDWGQGYDDLAAWQRERELAELNVWQFGPDPRWENGVMTPINGPAYAADKLPQFVADNRGRYLAVSLSNLYAYHRDTPVGKFLLEREPCARTQTFLIYDFRTAEPRPATDVAIEPTVFTRR